MTALFCNPTSRREATYAAQYAHRRDMAASVNYEEQCKFGRIHADVRETYTAWHVLAEQLRKMRGFMDRDPELASDALDAAIELFNAYAPVPALEKRYWAYLRRKLTNFRQCWRVPAGQHVEQR
jgi:hypothetical protein